MSRGPTILVVADHRGRDQLADDLRRRFATDYDVAALGSVEARDALGSGQLSPVAVVVAAEELADGASGLDLLVDVRRFEPHAQRVLLVPRGEWRGHAIRRAMALGHAEGYVFVPWQPREEWLYLPMSEYLAEWSRTREPEMHAVTIVGRRWDERSHHLRDLLARARIPYAFLESGSAEGRAALREMGSAGSSLPVLRFHTGQVAEDPPDSRVVEMLGFPAGPSMAEWDVAIVGAGPSGLSAAVYATSEGLSTVVLDPDVPGGQAGTSARIRNYLGFPRGLSGAELTTRAVEQSWLFGAEFLLAHRVVGLRTSGRRHVLTTDRGAEVRARSVVIATGVSWRRLGVPSVEEYVGSGVFYGAAGSEAEAMRGEHVVVVGGGNSAGQAAVQLAKHAASVTVVVRGPSLADTMSDYLIRELDAIPHVAVVASTEVVDASGDGRLQHLVLRHRDEGSMRRIDAAALFVMIGAVPHTEWLGPAFGRGPGGYLLTGDSASRSGRWSQDRPPLFLETTVPGVFAVGDVRDGATRRVAPSVGSGAIAIQLVHEYLALPGSETRG